MDFASKPFESILNRAWLKSRYCFTGAFNPFQKGTQDIFRTNMILGGLVDFGENCQRLVCNERNSRKGCQNRERQKVGALHEPWTFSILSLSNLIFV